ncbi:type IV pilus assembly protein PilM [Candidatus Gottesmanbacteria bacterium]|nr:type IV pilus assembly protein PilM [Candidatus Gottesmanbacteria bacterium]
MAARLPLGLDIGSQTIKLVELAPKDKGYWLQAAGIAPTPPKGFASDAQPDLEAVSVAIKKLVLDNRVANRQVNASLPESQIFTRVIEMPPLTETELASAIKWEAEQYVPMPLAEVKMDFAILTTPKKGEEGKMEVLLVAAPLTLISKYKKILEMAGLTPVSLESEIIAISRSLVGSSLTPTLIINLGAVTTDISIIRGGVLTFTRSIASGGEALARAVAKEMGFELSQAEEYKRTYGFEEDKLEGKILAAIKPIFDTVIEEIKRSLIFYQDKYPEEPIKIVSLCGGTAKLPGLVVYLAQNLSIETQIGNPWVNVTWDKKIFPKIEEEGPVFAVATGLAMKEIV